MSTTRHDDQTILFAVGAYGAYVLGARGGMAERDIADIGPALADLMPELKLPETYGLYVWDGTIIVDAGDEDADVRYEGRVKPAHTGHCIAFGIARPV